MNKITFPLKLRVQGSAVADLQDALQLCLDRRAILATDEGAHEELSAALKRERAAQIYGDATGKLVSIFQRERRLHASGEVDAPTANALNALLKEWGLIDQPGEPAPPGYQVAGKVVSRVSAGVGGLRVVIVDKGVGGDVQLAQATTDDSGAYQATFPDGDVRRHGKAQPDLQARVFAGDVFLGASDVRYNASPHETLNVLLDDKAASALRSEHEVLTGALASHFTGKLGDLKETGDQQDITYLANKTGWDARAVALAALADQFSARTVDATGAPAIPQAFFYALFRSGLPANEDTLYRTDAGMLQAVWTKAAQQGVIPKSSVEQTPQLIQRFQALSAQKLLAGPALAGVSSLKEMLTISRLNDAQQQAKFAQLYAANRADMPAFWKAVADAFGQNTANRLRVDGKLGFLTINNAPLMQKVHATVGPNGLSDPLQLAQMGYHRPGPWSRLLTADVRIPKEIPGDTPDAQRAKYANYLAAQVRLSYPTAAVAQMVKSGELPLAGATRGVSDQVHAFLTEHQGKFEIGVQPVEQYIAQNKLQVPGETVRQVKRLQRVYQITPSDQALTGLMKRGIDAAYHVARYDKGTFIKSFAADLGGADQAALTYDKSVQIHNAVLNLALSYVGARTAPAIGVHSPSSVLDPAPAHAGDVIAYATLESLFGSMDFCACEHCRSILSPAAYLVDLLLFLHADEQEWKDFCSTWRSAHGGAPYPFPNQATFNAAHQPPNTEISPLSVLRSRRPDIEHLPLTCENTNTALPYIDVVNETLEYFVANSIQKLSLSGYPGHDTNGAASEDLLASPQFVMDSAYATLRDERFPAPLPFHQSLENLRRYFNTFEVPLPLAMERFRKTDDLERGASPYGWRDILMEELGLSRAEYGILTDSTAVPFWRMYGFPNPTADADVIAGLSHAKQFARRVGMTYDDLVSVLTTRFINPNSDLIPKVERLGVSFGTLKGFKDGTISVADFDGRLAALAVPPDPAAYGGDPNAPKNDYTPIHAWVKNADNYARIMGLITLAIPAGAWAASKVYAVGDCVRPTAAQSESTLYYECTTAGTSAPAEPKWPTTPGNTSSDGTVIWTCRDDSSCLGFDNLAFRYADPAKITQNIGAVEFVRLLRFIRLWKKLGWTIEQTDAAISAFYRADLAPVGASDITDVPKLNAGFLTLLPRLGIIVRLMKALNLQAGRDLPSLLACWSAIGTHGGRALYRQMFLNPTLLKQDAVFADNGYGEFLTDTTQKLAGHAEALRSAFNLTGDEYDRIVAALGYDATTTLTIPTISAIFRRGWLARKLKLSVRELLLLIQLTGVDPFAAPDPTNPAILRLIFLVQALKDRSLKSAAALYLIWNQNLSGKSAPDPARVAAFARTLRAGFAAVQTDFAVADDPDGTIAQAQLAKVYGADAVAFFFGLINDTLTVEVEFSDLDGILALGAVVRQAVENAASKTDAGVPKIAYDDFRKRLAYSGVLTAATRDAIKSAAGAGAAAFKTAVDNLYNRNQAVISPFFTRYPELQSPYNAYVADATHSAAEKRNNLLKALLPELVRRRKRQQALQAVSAMANTDLAFAQAFLDSPAAPFPLHAARHADQPALNDFLALETQGLSVAFFANNTATGATIPSPDIASNLAYAPLVGGVGYPLPANPTPGAAISGVWRGYLEAPESGFFNLRVEADAGATVTLRLADKPVALAQNAMLWHNTDPIELRAGTLYAINLIVEKVRNVVRVQWEWEPKGQGRAVIPARYLYAAAQFDTFRETYVRFLKAASLAMGLSLTANELAYFATHADYRINTQGQIDSNGQGWLNALPNADNLHLTNPADAAIAQTLNAALLTPLRALLDFARIKADISPGDESLLTVLTDPTTATRSTDSLLFTITRWNPTSLNNALAQFGGSTAGLAHFGLFRRVYDAFALIQKMGVSAKAMIQATTNEPTDDTVRDLQAALRARYDAASWRDVVRPINDEMRSLQRDALVAYILHQLRSHPESAHIDTPDKLFEYFLMDVQMDPCMLTSRIRHALSSVQLFIERCLMNLEPRVSPAAINAKQWEWMKRYRVWEANRKVYLFPENWLEPELRDDKSPFFKEIEGELLQSDITEERAAIALLTYLSKLEEVAKLEACGIHYIPDSGKRTGEINHVVARTAGAHRKYYYRRYEYGYWTPWEQIKLDIEDNPVIPVVWNDRLFLFWLRILKQTPMTVPGAPPPGKKLQDLDASTVIQGKQPRVEVGAILCWSEYYNGKWQPTRTSETAHPLDLGTFEPNAFDRSKLKLSVLFWTKGALRVIISYETGFGASFLLHNAYSAPELRAGKKESHFSPKRTLETSTDTLKISYADSNVTNLVLDNAITARAVQPNHPVDGSPWDVPFFYEDARHVFYVTTSGQLVWVPQWDDFGIYVAPPKATLEIPPLVLERARIVSDLVGPIVRQPGFGGIDPSPIERYVTEDAYIHHAIGTSGTVRYGDTDIALAGSQVKSIRQR